MAEEGRWWTMGEMESLRWLSKDARGDRGFINSPPFGAGDKACSDLGRSHVWPDYQHGKNTHWVQSYGKGCPHDGGAISHGHSHRHCSPLGGIHSPAQVIVRARFVYRFGIATPAVDFVKTPLCGPPCL